MRLREMTISVWFIPRGDFVHGERFMQLCLHGDFVRLSCAASLLFVVGRQTLFCADFGSIVGRMCQC